jgi:hypothetical protein
VTLRAIRAIAAGLLLLGASSWARAEDGVLAGRHDDRHERPIRRVSPDGRGWLPLSGEIK